MEFENDAEVPLPEEARPELKRLRRLRPCDVNGLEDDIQETDEHHVNENKSWMKFQKRSVGIMIRNFPKFLQLPVSMACQRRQLLFSHWNVGWMSKIPPNMDHRGLTLGRAVAVSHWNWRMVSRNVRGTKQSPRRVKRIKRWERREKRIGRNGTENPPFQQPAQSHHYAQGEFRGGQKMDGLVRKLRLQSPANDPNIMAKRGYHLNMWHRVMHILLHIGSMNQWVWSMQGRLQRWHRSCSGTKVL